MKTAGIEAVCEKHAIRPFEDANAECYQPGATVQFFGAQAPHFGDQSEPTGSATASNPEPAEEESPADRVTGADEDEDWGDDDDGDCTEHCPICGAESDWGSANTCEHFIGMLFDSSILDCSVLSRLHDVWTMLDRLEAHYNENLLWALARRLQVGYKAFDFYMRNCEELVGDLSAIELLDSASRLFGLRIGSLTSTGGMLSGSATTIYAENPEFLSTLDTDLWGLASELEMACQEYHALQTTRQ